MTKYSDEQWEGKLKPYLQIIDRLGGKTLEMNVLREMKIGRSLLHSHLLRAEDFGLIKRSPEINGQRIMNNNVWALTDKGREVLDESI